MCLQLDIISRDGDEMATQRRNGGTKCAAVKNCEIILSTFRSSFSVHRQWILPWKVK